MELSLQTDFSKIATQLGGTMSMSSEERSAGVGIFSYLQAQNGSVVNKLYGSRDQDESSNRDQAPFVCKAVFQSLSAQAKNYLMRMIFSETPVTSADLSSWTTPAHLLQHNAAMEELVKLRVLQESFTEKDNNGDGNGDDGDDDDDVVILESMSSTTSIHSDNKRGASHTSGATFEVNPHFRRSFKQAFLAPQEPWGEYLESHNLQTSSGSSSSGYSGPSKDELRKLSNQKWDSLLRFLVGLQGATAVTVGGTIEIFVRKTGLMSDGSKNSANKGKSAATKQGLYNLRITELGYAYMLQPYQKQVWMFVYELIQSLQNKEELLSLLFMISYCEFGKGYPIRALTPIQQLLIMEFSQLGLVYACGCNYGDQGSIYDIEGTLASTTEELLFYPASISINMIFRSFGPDTQDLSSATVVGQESADIDTALGGKYQNMGSFQNIGGGGINRGEDIRSSITSGLEVIVETNMQIVAYLTSDLHLALLKLFVEFSVQLPNVAIGTITRDKAKEAFRMGIKVGQIIDFLCSHCHHLVKDMKPIIPTNVVDQLVLWESERLRIKSLDSILLQFDHIPGFDISQYQQIITYAKKINVCLANNDDKLSIVVTYQGYEQLRPFIEDLII